MKRVWSPLLLIVATCADPALDQPGAPCPCVAGFVCCETLGWCVAPSDPSCPDAIVIDDVTPTFGPLDGGTQITVRGRGFTTGDTVRVGGAPCDLAAEIADDRIECRTPPGQTDAPEVEVSVWRSSASFGRLDAAFRYVLPPFSKVRSGGVTPSVGGRGSVVADLDGDGRLDVYSAHGSGTPDQGVWFRNLGDLRFEDVTDPSMVALAGASSVPLAADLDGDGVTDLLVPAEGAVRGPRQAVLTFFRGLGGGVFEGRGLPFEREGAFLRHLRATDLDADGFLDVVACVEDEFPAGRPPLVVFFGSVDGPMEADVVTTTSVASDGDDCSAIALVDLDGDGRAEVVTATTSLRLFDTTGGRLEERTDLDAGEKQSMRFFSLHGADIDGDGDLDVVGTLDDRVGTFVWQNESGRLAPAPRWPLEGASYDYNPPGLTRTLAPGARDVAILDADLDGDLDLLYPQPVTQSLAIAPLFVERRVDGDTPAFFASLLPFDGALGEMTTVSVADFDDDGDPDVLVSSGRRPPVRRVVLRNGSSDNAGLEAPAGSYLSVRVLAAAGGDAYGTVVEMDLDGPTNAPDFAPGRGALAVRIIDAPHAPRAHFGLGERTEAVWIRARFADGSIAEKRVDIFDREVVLQQ